MFRKNNNQRGLLRVCTLSGTNEIGRNCNFLELGNDIIIVDAGNAFPSAEMYGIDYLIPNTAYLKKKKSNIRGILITHGHQDHIGALPYILKDLDYPTIYAGAFAVALIKEKLTEFDMLNRVKIEVVRANSIVNLGQFRARFIYVTHSIPDAYSIFIESPKGNVFISGDYKIDLDPPNEPETDYEALKSLQGKVDLALMESTNAYKPGKALSETEVAKTLERIITNHNGRVVVAAFASLVTRLYSIMQIALRSGRKVVLAGRSIETAVRVAREQRYIDVPDDLFVRLTEMGKYQDNQLILLVTGSQAERYSSLDRISLSEHKNIKVKKTDLVIMSSSEIPGNISKIERMTDRLIKQGMDLLKSNEEDVHASGHGLQDDMKMMYEMVKPRYVMPVHGSLTFRYQNKKNYVSWGHPIDQVLLTEDGNTWEFEGRGWRRGTNVESKPILIDGLGVGDTGDVVLKDRAKLAEYGMFVIILNIAQQTKKLLGRPKFISRGFIYMKTSQEILREIENIIRDTHRKWVGSHRDRRKLDDRKLIEDVERQVNRYIRRKTEREPIILPVIV
jgi:ribonuclease J